MKAIFCSILILIAANAFADSMPCRKGTVSTGDLAVDILPKCGFPTTVIKGGDIEHKGQYTADTNKLMDEWVYDFGPSEFKYKLFIINGVVSSIENLGENSKMKE